MLHQNLAYLLEKRREVSPQAIAVVEAHSDRRYTYEDLCRRVCALAHALKAAGLHRGDRLCCLTGNTVEYLQLFFAAARLGASVSPINYPLSPADAAKILADADPKVFVFDSMFGDLARDLVHGDGRPRTVLRFGEAGPGWAEGKGGGGAA